jgi:hypothetical protein
VRRCGAGAGVVAVKAAPASDADDVPDTELFDTELFDTELFGTELFGTALFETALFETARFEPHAARARTASAVTATARPRFADRARNDTLPSLVLDPTRAAGHCLPLPLICTLGKQKMNRRGTNRRPLTVI